MNTKRHEWDGARLCEGWGHQPQQCSIPRALPPKSINGGGPVPSAEHLLGAMEPADQHAERVLGAPKFGKLYHYPIDALAIRELLRLVPHPDTAALRPLRVHSWLNNKNDNSKK